MKSSLRFFGRFVLAALSLLQTLALFAAQTSPSTFNKEVAPILFKHCASCHRPGEAASNLSFLSYDSTRPWASEIKEAVVRREMPPWPAASQGSLKFRNDSRLSQKEIAALVAWVDAGAPQGKASDLPALPKFPKGWLHPGGVAPDAVVAMPEFHVPATGEIPYVRQMIKVPLTEDKWVSAMQVLPGNAALVHHMAITEVELDKGVTPADLDKLSLIANKLGLPSDSVANRPAVVDPVNPAVFDMLGVYTPGTTFESYGNGNAKLLKGGGNYYLNFNIHYQTTGTSETDQSKLAFWFEKGTPEHQLFRVPASGKTILANGKQLLTDAPGEKAEGTDVVIPPIPPYADNYELVGITAYTEPVTIYQLQPHAHLRGKDFRYTIVYPDGREQSVLNVPHYSFHWQLAYQLDTPLRLPAGSKLVVTAHYDNSVNNEHLMHHGMQGMAGMSHNESMTENSDPNAPGPEKEVYFREMNQSWNEMFTPFIQYSVDTPLPSTGAEERQHLLPVVEAVGCLRQGRAGTWRLAQGSDVTVSSAQSTSSAELQAAAAKPLGGQEYPLLGAAVFTPPNDKGWKVEVKGVLIKRDQGNSINVTSLQSTGEPCSSDGAPVKNGLLLSPR